LFKFSGSIARRTHLRLAKQFQNFLSGFREKVGQSAAEISKNAVFGIFDPKLRKALYKTRQTFYGLLFISHMSTNSESFVRIHRRVFAVGSSKVAEISKICFASPKNLGDGGLTLPHRRVGSTTEILRVHGAPLYFTPSIFHEFF